MGGAAPALRTTDLGVRHGGVVALAGVDLEVHPGEVVGLIGPNGAGKSTFVDAVTGFVAHTGTVEVDGADLSTAPPHQRARRGLARTWQSVELFDGLTVREQCVVASSPGRSRSVLADLVRLRPRAADAAVDEALDLLGLAGDAGRDAASLPAGRRQLVGVARALSARPSVVLLDEPAAGLSAEERRSLGGTLRTVAAAGTAMLLVEHDTELVFEVCDRVVVLDVGSVVVAGSPAEVRADPRVVTAYLGAPPGGPVR